MLHLKGTTLRAKEVSKDAKHAVNLVADNMERQVKRHRDKRRGRRETRAAVEATAARARLDAATGTPAERVRTPGGGLGRDLRGPLG